MKTAPISVQLIDVCGSDLSTVNAARVSFDKESIFEELWNPVTEKLEKQVSDRDAKLISYLAKHEHKSPFNHSFASFRVKAPIFVARQLVKHKFLPWNEVSRRYVDSEPEFWFPEAYRKRSENVKQGSSEETAPRAWVAASADLLHPVLCHYRHMIESGICPEQARMVLPQNTMTEWIWSGTLGAWADMCRLRLDPHAQLETREVAQQIANHMQGHFPVSWKALMEV